MKTDSEFYIKEIKVSRSAITGVPEEKCDTSLTTVVAHRNCQTEAVYNAVISFSADGRKLVKHESYLRSSNRLTDTSGTLRRVKSVNDKADTIINKEPQKQKKPKIFKWSSMKKNKKNEVNVKERNKFEDTRANENKKDRKNTSIFNFSNKRDMPFQSYSIGASPTSKTKKRSGSVFDMFKSFREDDKEKTNVKTQQTKEYSATLVGMGAKTVTVILDSDQDEFAIETDVVNNTNEIILDEDAFIDEIRIDLCAPKKNIRKMSCPDLTCNCEKRKLDEISSIMLNMIKKVPENEIKNSANQYDNQSHHYYDCPFVDMPYIDEDNKLKQSTLSLYQNCEICDSMDDHLSPGISSALLPMIEEIEEGLEIQFTEDYLNFFLTSKCYVHFERGLKQSIGPQCTPYNLARLHDVTRRIVRHIGDPNKDDNKQIKKILGYVQRFYSGYFEEHIKKHHKSVVDFLLNCHCDEIDD